MTPTIKCRESFDALLMAIEQFSDFKDVVAKTETKNIKEELLDFELETFVVSKPC